MHAAPVILDVTRLVGRLMKNRLPTGVDRVSLAYVRHYGHGARALVRLGRRSGLFSNVMSARLFDLLLRWPPDRRAKVLSLACQGAASGIGRGDGGGRFMFNTGHSGLEDASTARLVRRHRVRPVFMVHDLIPLRHPEFCRPGEAERHAARLANMLRLGVGLVTNSQATLQDVLAFAEARGLPVPPAVVAPLAPEPALATAESSSSKIDSRPYFVVLGTVEPRKNHAMLLDAWEHLVQRLANAAPRLVIVGQRGWESEDVERRLTADGPLRGHVTALRKCADAELAALLRRARALLFPSFAEGYGLPVAEALAAGVPVIASDLPVLREFAGRIPDYLDPRDTLAWAARVQDYARLDSPARAGQLLRMPEFAAPAWTRHFDVVDDFLARLDANR